MPCGEAAPNRTAPTTGTVIALPGNYMDGKQPDWLMGLATVPARRVQKERLRPPCLANCISWSGKACIAISSAPFKRRWWR